MDFPCWMYIASQHDGLEHGNAFEDILLDLKLESPMLPPKRGDGSVDISALLRYSELGIQMRILRFDKSYDSNSFRIDRGFKVFDFHTYLGKMNPS